MPIAHYIPTRSPYTELWENSLTLAAHFDNLSLGRDDAINEKDLATLAWVMDKLNVIPLSSDPDSIIDGWREAKVFVEEFGDTSSDNFKLVSELKDAARAIRDDMVQKLNSAHTALSFGQPIEPIEAKEIRDLLMNMVKLRQGTAEPVY